MPQRYQVITKCKVADHLGRTSDEIDIAICDRQYSTLVVKAESRQRVPAEAVYAVLEVKPRVNRDHVLYAADKVESVRGLARTSAPIVHAGGRIDEFARERTKLYRLEFTADHFERYDLNKLALRHLEGGPTPFSRRTQTLAVSTMV